MYSVLFGIPQCPHNRSTLWGQVPPRVRFRVSQAVKMEKQLEENRDIRDRDAPAKHGQLCAVIREERAEELASAGMGSAARKRRAMAVLKSALTKQWDTDGEIKICWLMSDIRVQPYEKYCEISDIMELFLIIQFHTLWIFSKILLIINWKILWYINK